MEFGHIRHAFLHGDRNGHFAFGAIRARFHNISFNGGFHAPQVLEHVFDIVVMQLVSVLNNLAIAVQHQQDGEQEHDYQSGQELRVTECEYALEKSAYTVYKEIACCNSLHLRYLRYLCHLCH